MSMLRSVKAASRHVASLSLLLLALAGVSAAPKGHSVSVQPRRAPTTLRSTVGLPARLQQPPIHSAEALRRYVTELRQWGNEHNARVKTDYLETQLFRLQHLAYPNDRVDWNAYARGLAQRDRLPAARFGAAQTNVSATALPQTWEFVGPTGLQVPQRTHFGQGSISGRVNALAYDPNVSSTYWLGAASGGVWKSVNSGQSWTFLSQSWPGLEVSAIATHPTDSNVVYVGTGDFHGFGVYGFGIMKTTDGGVTWTNLGRAEMGGYAVSDIVVDPENPQIVIACTGRGRGGMGQVWRSTNGGQSWTAVINTPAEWSGLALGALSNGTRNLWAVGHSVGGEVWLSTDRGATWAKLTTPPLTNDVANPQIGLDIAASRISPETAYLISGTDRVILRTTDSGATWANITAGFPNDDTAGDNYNWSQSYYDFHINTGVNGQEDVVYVGLLDLVASPNGGANWASLAAAYTQNALIHDGQHCVAVNPRSPNEVLVGNDGGVYRMIYTPVTNTATFNTQLNTRLGITQIHKADYHPSDPDRMIAGAQDNGTPVALGDLVQWRNVTPGDGGGCVINPVNASIQYASSSLFKIFRTEDQWTTQQEITPNWGNDNLPVVGRLALDPSRPNVLYAGTNYLWRWNDTTQNWTPRLGNAVLASGSGTILAIAVAPNDQNTIYTGASTGEIFMTTNGGTTWVPIHSGATSLPNRSVLSIAVHPTNPRDIVVGLSGTGAPHLWRCADTASGARVWTNVSGGGVTALPDVPVNAVVLDPATPSTRFYVGTDAGVFRSQDGGATWENATAPLSLPNVIVSDLKIVPGTGYLMAATYGRGIWRIDPQAAETRLTITYPNGGEVIVVGETTNIQWTTSGFGAGHTVRIELSRDGGMTYPEVLAASAPDTGSFAWIPQIPVSATARIRITSNTDGSISDVSDADFSIVQGSLTLVAPNGGELIRFGETYRIRWTATDFVLSSPTVRIELSRDGGMTYPELLFANVPTAAGEVDWVATGPATPNARIRITAVNAPVFTDTSDANFEIREPSKLTLQRPNGGESFVTGSQVNILWTSTGLSGNVRIEVSRNGGGSWEVLFPNTENDGAEIWTVSGSGTRFGRIRVTSIDEPDVSDQSDGVFTIESPSLTTTGPSAGTTLLLGMPATATWTTTGMGINDNVQVELSRDGGITWEQISGSAPNTGALTFTVTGVATTQAHIRVTSLTHPELSSVSAQFSIQQPSLFLVSPAAKDRWVIGDQQIITWSGTAVGYGWVEIELSRNGGKRWETIIEDTPCDGGQAWGVRGKKTKKARIRLTWYAPNGSILTTESKNFRIVAPKKKKKKR